MEDVVCMRTFCVIPHASRGHPSVLEVHADRLLLEVPSSSNGGSTLRQIALPFSSVLSVVHPLHMHIVAPLLEAFAGGRSAGLLLASPPPAKGTVVTQSLLGGGPALEAIDECTTAHLSLLSDLLPAISAVAESVGHRTLEVSIVEVSAENGKARDALVPLSNTNRHCAHTLARLSAATVVSLPFGTGACEEIWAEVLELFRRQRFSQDDHRPPAAPLWADRRSRGASWMGAAPSNPAETAVVVTVHLPGTGCRFVIGDLGSAPALLQQATLSLRQEPLLFDRPRCFTADGEVEASQATIPPRGSILAELLAPISSVVDEVGFETAIVTIPNLVTAPKEAVRLLHFASDLTSPFAAEAAAGDALGFSDEEAGGDGNNIVPLEQETDLDHLPPEASVEIKRHYYYDAGSLLVPAPRTPTMGSGGAPPQQGRPPVAPLPAQPSRGHLHLNQTPAPIARALDLQSGPYLHPAPLPVDATIWVQGDEGKPTQPVKGDWRRELLVSYNVADEERRAAGTLWWQRPPPQSAPRGAFTASELTATSASLRGTYSPRRAGDVNVVSAPQPPDRPAVVSDASQPMSAAVSVPQVSLPVPRPASGATPPASVTPQEADAVQRTCSRSSSVPAGDALQDTIEALRQELAEVRELVQAGEGGGSLGPAMRESSRPATPRRTSVRTTNPKESSAHHAVSAVEVRSAAKAGGGSSSGANGGAVAAVIDKLYKRFADMEVMYDKDLISLRNAQRQNAALVAENDALQKELTESRKTVKQMQRKETAKLRNHALSRMYTAAKASAEGNGSSTAAKTDFYSPPPKKRTGRGDSTVAAPVPSAKDTTSELRQGLLSAQTVELQDLRRRLSSLEKENQTLRRKCGIATTPARGKGPLAVRHDEPGIMTAAGAERSAEAASRIALYFENERHDLRDQIARYNNEVLRIASERDELRRLLEAHPRAPRASEHVAAVVSALTNGCDDLLAALRVVEERVTAERNEAAESNDRTQRRISPARSHGRHSSAGSTVTAAVSAKNTTLVSIHQHRDAIERLRASVKDIMSRLAAGGTDAIAATASQQDTEMMAYYLSFEVERLTTLRSYIPTFAQLCAGVKQLRTF